MSDVRTNQELLQRIHSLHRQLNEIAGRRARSERAVAIAQRKLALAQEKLDAVKQEHAALLVDARDKESKFSAWTDSLQRRENQLSAAKTNKEYSSLQAQIAADKIANDQLADEALEAIEKAEEHQAAVDAAAKEVQEAQMLIEQAQKTLDEETPTFDADTASRQAALAVEVEKLSREYRPLYDRVVQHFGGEAGMAPIADQKYCGSCRHQIPARFIAQICQNQPYLCESCGRLIFFPVGYVVK